MAEWLFNIRSFCIFILSSAARAPRTTCTKSIIQQIIKRVKVLGFFSPWFVFLLTIGQFKVLLLSPGAILRGGVGVRGHTSRGAPSSRCHPSLTLLRKAAHPFRVCLVALRGHFLEWTGMLWRAAHPFLDPLRSSTWWRKGLVPDVAAVSEKGNFDFAFLTASPLYGHHIEATWSGCSFIGNHVWLLALYLYELIPTTWFVSMLLLKRCQVWY